MARVKDNNSIGLELQGGRAQQREKSLLRVYEVEEKVIFNKLGTIPQSHPQSVPVGDAAAGNQRNRPIGCE
jgi:hypothetical protein